MDQIAENGLQSQKFVTQQVIQLRDCRKQVSEQDADVGRGILQPRKQILQKEVNELREFTQTLVLRVCNITVASTCLVGAASSDTNGETATKTSGGIIRK